LTLLANNHGDLKIFDFNFFQLCGCLPAHTIAVEMNSGFEIISLAKIIFVFDKNIMVFLKKVNVLSIVTRQFLCKILQYSIVFV
jgi:hypothetical protein